MFAPTDGDGWIGNVKADWTGEILWYRLYEAVAVDSHDGRISRRSGTDEEDRLGGKASRQRATKAVASKGVSESDEHAQGSQAGGVSESGEGQEAEAGKSSEQMALSRQARLAAS